MTGCRQNLILEEVEVRRDLDVSPEPGYQMQLLAVVPHQLGLIDEGADQPLPGRALIRSGQRPERERLWCLQDVHLVAPGDRLDGARPVRRPGNGLEAGDRGDPIAVLARRLDVRRD